VFRRFHGSSVGRSADAPDGLVLQPFRRRFRMKMTHFRQAVLPVVGVAVTYKNDTHMKNPPYVRFLLL
jgi:hypothetical protein